MYLLSQSHRERENETKEYNTENPPPCEIGPGVYRIPPPRELSRIAYSNN